MAGKQPIIIKKKKVIQAAGHHGGAWKVAYADFVTAMMAFFLLMWLLNATTEEQRKGIADYFNPTIPVAAVSGGGNDALSGDSVLTEETLSKSGIHQSANPRKAVIPEDEAIQQEIEQLAKKAGIDDAEGRIRVRKTEEGTVIELVDVQGKPLFKTGSATPSEEMQVLIASAASVVKRTGAHVKITGHTDALGYASDQYSNWELSSDRANSARRMLIDAGVGRDKFDEVAGLADREPISDDPNDPVNRRIAIVLKDPEKAKKARAKLR